MGKREVRMIVVPKWATIALLIAVSAVMAALILYLSGKAYTNGREPLRDLLLRLMQRGGEIPRHAIVASIMPTLANILFFLPWGFLMFLAVDTPSRSRGKSYLITVISGALFAIAMEVWQSFLPTRVMGLPDTVANAFGALAGAVAGHLRKRVRVQFDY
jgi:glycopeptide antibiotics resistance protein